MQWIKDNVRTVVWLALMLGASFAAFARVEVRQANLCEAIKRKADKEPMFRELDNVNRTVNRIETKLDNYIQRNSG